MSRSLIRVTFATYADDWGDIEDHIKGVYYTDHGFWFLYQGLDSMKELIRKVRERYTDLHIFGPIVALPSQVSCDVRSALRLSDKNQYVTVGFVLMRSLPEYPDRDVCCADDEQLRKLFPESPQDNFVVW